MKKAIVLASSRHAFINFLRHFVLNPNDYKYAMYGDIGEVQGHHWDTPVIMLEGYQHNRNYTLNFMRFIGHRFNHIGFLSEGEMYNDY